MKRLMSLIVGAILLSMLSITSLNASMKCGPGKCGAAMSAPEMKKPACCEAKADEMKKPACCEAKAAGKACACPSEAKCSCKDKANCTCDAKKSPKAMKCGTGKCS